MAKDENGAYNVKFGTVDQVHRVIDHILDRNQSESLTSTYAQTNHLLEYGDFKQGDSKDNK